MKSLVTTLLCFAPILALACSSAPSAQESCDRVKSLCNQSSSSDAGSVSISVTCNADALDKLSNADEVKNCIKDASDCNAATACMLKAKQ